MYNLINAEMSETENASVLAPHHPCARNILAVFRRYYKTAGMLPKTKEVSYK